MFKKIQKSVYQMVEMFKVSKFFLCVAQKQNYKDGIVFTENNIVQYLAELEEYISSLIQYTAFKRDEPNAAISSIPLEKLNQKKFEQQKVAIEAPDTWEPAHDMNPEAVDAEIINAKELY